MTSVSWVCAVFVFSLLAGSARGGGYAMDTGRDAVDSGQSTSGGASGTQPSSAEQWCLKLADAARKEAAADGFDEATQKRRADLAYQQCMKYPGDYTQ
jgi:hypothetical protein